SNRCSLAPQPGRRDGEGKGDRVHARVAREGRSRQEMGRRRRRRSRGARRDGSRRDGDRARLQPRAIDRSSPRRRRCDGDGRRDPRALAARARHALRHVDEGAGVRRGRSPERALDAPRARAPSRPARSPAISRERRRDHAPRSRRSLRAREPDRVERGARAAHRRAARTIGARDRRRTALRARRAPDEAAARALEGRDPHVIDALLKIAADATAIILEKYEGELSVEWKGVNDPVTALDKEVNAFVVGAIEKAFPGIPVIAEESDPASWAARRGPVAFFVDPIDGTRDLIERTGDFCVMLGLVEDNRPTKGVIAWPTKRRTFFGEKGKGAFEIARDGSRKPIRVAPTPKD